MSADHSQYSEYPVIYSGGSRGGARGSRPLPEQGRSHKRKKGWQGKQNKTPPLLSPLGQGLDPSLIYICKENKQALILFHVAN